MNSWNLGYEIKIYQKTWNGFFAILNKYLLKALKNILNLQNQDDKMFWNCLCRVASRMFGVCLRASFRRMTFVSLRNNVILRVSRKNFGFPVKLMHNTDPKTPWPSFRTAQKQPGKRNCVWAYSPLRQSHFSICFVGHTLAHPHGGRRGIRRMGHCRKQSADPLARQSRAPMSGLLSTPGS